jgi:hypothetical protein
MHILVETNPTVQCRPALRIWMTCFSTFGRMTPQSNRYFMGKAEPKRCHGDCGSVVSASVFIIVTIKHTRMRLAHRSIPTWCAHSTRQTTACRISSRIFLKRAVSSLKTIATHQNEHRILDRPPHLFSTRRSGEPEPTCIASNSSSSVNMEEESNASMHAKEVTRLWRAWRTIHEMAQDRVRSRRHCHSLLSTALTLPTAGLRAGRRGSQDLA